MGKKTIGFFRKKTTLAAIIIIEVILAVLMLLVLSESVSINSKEEKDYADSDYTDEISCSDGQLIVNDIVVSVPTDNKVSYNISYAWGKDDTDYPTIPQSVTASYYSKKGSLLYDISLFRESFTANDSIPDGKDASNWFSDWEEKNTDEVKREAKKVGDIDGFVVSTVSGKNSDSGSSVYESYSFYFAVKDKEGISVYVLEGNLYNDKAKELFQKNMEQVISTIKNRKPA